MEYGGVVWDQPTATDNNKLEMVQRRFARFIKKDYSRTSSVTTMLQDLGWETLKERCGKARATMMYRIKNDLVDIQSATHLTPITTRSRRGNDEFRVPYARTISFQNSFFPDGVRIWNSLPRDVTTADNLEKFKTRLSRHTIRQ